jgi:alpha-1,3/alpha-1,6-mannosyltransferase
MVPLEAMAAQRPVVACASGGPLESIVDGETGALCPPTPAAFAHAAARLLLDPAGACPSLEFAALSHPRAPAAAEREGVAARRRVEAHFSRASFGTKLNKLVLQLAE